MDFEEIREGTLWAVRYDEEEDSELYRLFKEWFDVDYLYDFFTKNFKDLEYFNVKSVKEAVNDTLDDAEELEEVFLDIDIYIDFEERFKPLDNRVGTPHEREKMKSKGEHKRHASWLRIYAIRLSAGIYIVTGGAIKLTKEMKERDHTRRELEKLEKVKRFLIDNHIVDDEGFIDYLAET